jgi:hypothetical protein
MRFAAVVVAATALVSSSTARADDAAPAIFKRAESEYARGEYRVAAEDFDLAYARDPRGASAYNGAQAWEAAGDVARAADDLVRALTSGDLPASFAVGGRARLSRLVASLARVEVLAPSGARVSIGGARDEVTPLRVHLPQGSHALHVVFADGREETRRIPVLAGEARTIVIEPPSPASAPSPAAAVSAPARAEAPPAATEARPATHGTSARATWGWITLGGAAALGAASVGLYVDARSARDAYVSEHAANGTIDASLHDRAQQHLVMSWVGAGAAIAAAGVGVYLLVTPSSDGVRVAIGPGEVRVGGRF